MFIVVIKQKLLSLAFCPFVHEIQLFLEHLIIIYYHFLDFKIINTFKF